MIHLYKRHNYTIWMIQKKIPLTMKIWVNKSKHDTESILEVVDLLLDFLQIQIHTIKSHHKSIVSEKSHIACVSRFHRSQLVNTKATLINTHNWSHKYMYKLIYFKFSHRYIIGRVWRVKLVGGKKIEQCLTVVKLTSCLNSIVSVIVDPLRECISS